MKKIEKIMFTTGLFACLGFSAAAQRTIHLNPCALPIDQDDFTNAAAWTQVDPEIHGNGRVIVNTISGYAEMTNAESNPANTCAAVQGAASNREIRLYRALSGTLSNSNWRAEFTINITGGNGPGHGLMGFSSGTIDPEGYYAAPPTWGCTGSNTPSGAFTPSTEDGIYASIVAFGTAQVPHAYNDQTFDLTKQTPANNATQTGGWCIYGHAKKSNGSFYPASSPFNSAQLNWSWGIPLPNINTNYYIRLERLNPNECIISVFSDAAMTTHVPMSPQCFQVDPTIQNLSYAQNFTHQSGSYYRSLAGSVSNLKVFNGCPAIPTLTLSASSTTLTCPSSCATLSATPGATSYTWNPGNIVTTTNTLTVCPSVTTTYSVDAVFSGYPCHISSAAVTVNVNFINYITFNPQFSIVSGLPAGGSTFTVGVTPITGSTNLDISNARTSTGYNYGYLWNVETLDPANNSNVLCSVSNPSNWWNNAATNYFPGYTGNSSGVCSDNTSITTGLGSFDIGYKYRITRGVWNPCAYSSSTVAVSYCVNCRTANGTGGFVIEGGQEGGTRPVAVKGSISGPEETVLSVAPNPNNGEFTINITNELKTYTYEVYDSYGKQVLSSSSGNSKQAVSMPDAGRGVYFLKVNLDGKMYTKRMVVQ